MFNDIKIHFADLNDLSSWMQLVESVRWNFPGLETQELLDGYRDTVIKNINRRSAICAKDQDLVIGILLFSEKHCALSCMAVHPSYRRTGVATKMMNLMMEHLPAKRDIVVTTFREDDVNGAAPRALYKKFGFVEDELCSSFNYPDQKFILRRNQ